MPSSPAAIDSYFKSRAAISIWQAPFVPVALAATAGIMLDRYAGAPLLFSMIAALAGLVARHAHVVGGVRMACRHSGGLPYSSAASSSPQSHASRRAVTSSNSRNMNPLTSTFRCTM